MSKEHHEHFHNLLRLAVCVQQLRWRIVPAGFERAPRLPPAAPGEPRPPHRH